MERIGVEPGTEIGGYRVLGPLGAGGMGAVYRAVDGAGVAVALKVLHPHLGADPAARERLRREVAHLQRVRHPGVARVIDAEIDSTEAFVVTELVEGEDLAAVVRRDGPLAPDRLAALAEQLRAALVVVHGAGVLHRDLTPGNVLLTGMDQDTGAVEGDDGDPVPSEAVLIDFGIAQAADDARVTSTGMVVGTPGYLSPELLEGGEPSEAGDWWGWAALLAFAATGRPPFGVRPVGAVLARVRTGEADLDGLDPRTTRALRSALALDPDLRGGPEELVAELRLAAEGDTEVPDDEAFDGQDDVTAVMAAGSETEGPDGADAGLTATVVVASDGRTAVMPLPDDVDGGGDGTAAGRRDESDDGDDGVTGPDRAAGDQVPEDYGADDYGSEDYGAEDYEAGDEVLDEDEGEDLPPEPRRRVGSVLAVAALLTAFGAVRPGIALAVGVGIAVLVRAVGLAVASAHARGVRGGSARDVLRGIAFSPWYLLRAVVGTLPSALVAASSVVVVGGVGWWALATGRVVVAAPPDGGSAGALDQNAEWVAPALLALAVLIGLVALWFGPMSRTTRVGGRWTLAALAPGRPGALTLVVVALALTAVVVTLGVLGQDTVWWPLPGPPELR